MGTTWIVLRQSGGLAVVSEYTDEQEARASFEEACETLRAARADRRRAGDESVDGVSVSLLTQRARMS